jgi:AcrR family transcriptional regulator
MAEPPGRRERKKEQTRLRIAETARRLFRERGFDRVTVAEVAREADVAEQTVYNYFPTKEDLVYWRLESFEEGLLEAIRERVPGESIPAAFGRWLLEQRGMLADTPISDDLTAVSRTIAESPALLAREEQVFARYTRSLAELIAQETGAGPDDIRPRVAATALLGIQRALVDYARGRILAGARNPGLARDVRAQAGKALAALEHGFGAQPEAELLRPPPPAPGG